MPVALRNVSGKCPDIILSGLYDTVLQRSLGSALKGLLDTTDHLYHSTLFMWDVLALGYRSIDLDEVDKCPVFVFLDCPSRHTLYHLYRNFQPKKVILVLAEHPSYQPRYMGDLVKQVDLCIHSYQLPQSTLPKESVPTSTSFVYREIPRIVPLREFGFSPFYEASIFCSDLVKRKPSMYAFRRHLINGSTAVFGDKFAHYGRYWKYGFSSSSQSVSFHSRIKKRVKELVYGYPNVITTSYLGSPRTKLALFSCKTTFAIENFMGPPGYTTEKPLECLSYGCVPIYAGPELSNWLVNFIPVKPPRALDLISDAVSYSGASRQDMQQIAEKTRCDINKYLKTDDGSSSLSALYTVIKNLCS